MSIVYLNGEFLPLDEARVSVLDRGFIFGDGVYEVIPVYGGRLFRLAQHLKRLHNSLTAVRIANPLDTEQWRTVLEGIVARHGTADQSLYLQVTRGVAKRDHSFPADTVPTVFVMSSPLAPPAPDVLAQGVKAITLDDIRWQYCQVKAITLLANVLLRQQAIDGDAAEAILLRDGQVTEGAASNVFVVDDGVILTPPKDERLLPGITRDLVVELAAANGLPCLEKPVSQAVLAQATEIWLTSSTREVVPVTRLDNAAVGGGTPGPAWKRMYDIFQDYKDALREGREH
ncbi:MAG: D-amino acid aminotransferase [Pseudomonadota bacterium]|nr:MAG: D-amino acid aminotransferase [Pseudomonadota bacterium]